MLKLPAGRVVPDATCCAYTRTHALQHLWTCVSSSPIPSSFGRTQPRASVSGASASSGCGHGGMHQHRAILIDLVPTGATCAIREAAALPVGRSSARLPLRKPIVRHRIPCAACGAQSVGGTAPRGRGQRCWRVARSPSVRGRPGAAVICVREGLSFVPPHVAVMRCQRARRMSSAPLAAAAPVGEWPPRGRESRDSWLVTPKGDIRRAVTAERETTIPIKV